MTRILQMRQHRRVILTLRSDLSLYDGKPIFRVTLEPSENSRHVATICERLERAHRTGDWCTIDVLMEEIQSFRIWLYEDKRYIPYNVIGVPCIRQGVLRFKEWLRWDGRGRDFPELRRGHDFPELARGHDFAELPDDGPDFPELGHRHDFPELIE
jgi:hypothetical protein